MSADDLIAAYLETGVLDDAEFATLSADDRARIATALPELDQLRAVLGAEEGWVEPHAGLEDSVLEMILAEPALEASAPTPPPLTDPDDDVTSPVLILPTPPMGDADADAPWSSNAAGPGGSVTSLADARLRRSKMVATGASIVAAAAILVAVVGFTRSSAPDQTASPTSNTTVAGAVIVEDEGVVLKATATGLFPNASGTAALKETSSGVRIHLKATGLPRRENGQFYQAWVKTEKGLVPVGTFHTGDDVVLWSGIDMGGFTAITITIEDDDNVQDSSGQRALLIALPNTTTSGTTPGSTPGSSPGSTPGSTPGTTAKSGATTTTRSGQAITSTTKKR